MILDIPLVYLTVVTLAAVLVQVAFKGYRWYSDAQNLAVKKDEEFREYLKPRLEIILDPSDDDLVIDDPRLPARRVRVKLKNVSGKTIEDVAVELKGTDPPIQPGVLPLKLMNKDRRGSVLNPGRELPVDVFYKEARQEFVEITHDVLGLGQVGFPAESKREIWLVASGRDVAPMEPFRLTLYTMPDRLIMLKRM